MKSDMRVRYTRQIILRAFSDLLMEKPVQSITVREICGRAEINRTTFYRHFRDIYDLLDQFEQEAADALLKLIDSNSGGSALLTILIQIKRNAEPICKLLKNGRIDFLERLAVQCFQKIRKEKDESVLASPIHYSCYSGAIGGLVGYWVSSGMQESPEEMAEIIQQLTNKLLA